MKILISGSSGLVGSALCSALVSDGHTIVCLVRRVPRDSSEVFWDPAASQIEQDKLEGLDAVIHLAGESVVGGFWTKAKKERIRSSRIEGTALLCGALAKLTQPPKTLLCASAIGFYGDRGDEVITEESPSGTGFLAEACREWEAASASAQRRGIRVIHARIGLVLSRKGGALHTMLFPFQLGLGGKLGSGEQFMSWISIEDVVQAMIFLLKSNLSGAFNFVGPEPVRNIEFTRELGRALHRPTFFSVPALFFRLLPGGQGQELFLVSCRVLPKRLTEAGYRFVEPRLKESLVNRLTNS